MNNTIVLMTKTPIHGIIKTKLAKAIGNCNAKRFTLLNIENIQKILINKKNIEFFLYTTPQIKFRSFSFSFSRNSFPQKGLTLGDKIWYFKLMINNNFILIGSDIPSINFKYLFK